VPLSRYHGAVDPLAPNNAHASALQLIGFNQTVLELGAASGHVTAALVQRHCRVTSVEQDAEVAQELYGLADRVIVGDLDDPAVLDGVEDTFDVVLAGDVLEHLRDPHRVLRQAAQLLGPGGRVVVSLPNVAHADLRLALLLGRWEYRPWGLMDSTHVRFFTRDGIDLLVEQAGLVISELRRVRIPAFESELGIERGAVPTETVDLVLADPEAETYQFVFAAVRHDGDHEIRELAAGKRRMTGDLERALARQQTAEAELTERSAQFEVDLSERSARFQSELAERSAHHADQIAQITAEMEAARVAAAQAELDGARIAAAEAREEVAALASALADAERRLARVSASVVWQTFQRLRRAMFALLGGEGSLPARGAQKLLRGAGRALGLPPR
jgi:2-polyprenyl-3-methyl-5-hydroxy-6-metoxy-1,4-benzoquinol methylase